MKGLSDTIGRTRGVVLLYDLVLLQKCMLQEDRSASKTIVPAP